MVHPLKGEIRKIAVLRGGALGDVVLTVPAMRLLRERFPNSELTLISDPYSGRILEGLPFFDKFVAVHASESDAFTYFRRLREIAQTNFDLLVDFQATGRSRIQTLLINGRNRMGYERDWIRNRFYTLYGPLNRDRHRVLSFVHFLQPLGIVEDERELPLQISISDAENEEAAHVLESAGIHNEPFAIVHPTFSARPPHQVWPDEAFIDVARGVHERGFRVAMTSGPDGKETIERLARAAGIPVANLAGKTAPRVLAAVMARSKLYVGYNTGPMHVGAAVGTPIVTLFEEPSKFPEWRPWSSAPWHVLLPDNVHEGTDQPPLWRMDTIPSSRVLAAADLAIVGKTSLEPIVR